MAQNEKYARIFFGAPNSVERVCVLKSALRVLQEGNKVSGLGVAYCYEGNKVGASIFTIPRQGRDLIVESEEYAPLEEFFHFYDLQDP